MSNNMQTNPENEDAKSEATNDTAQLMEKFNSLAEQLKESKEHIKKLNEENKNRRLTEKELKQVLAESLGLKEDEKPEASVIKDQLNSLTGTVKQLQEALESERADKAKVLKESSVKELANKFNFADPMDALRFVDVNSSNVEDELRKLAESKPYLLKGKSDIKAVNQSNVKNIPNDIDQQIAEAIKKGDIQTSIALKNKKFNIQ